MRKLLLISLLVLGAISGCGGGGSSAPPPAITVSIAAQPSSVQVNGSAQFTASVANSSNPGVTWSLTQGGTSCSPGCGTLSSTTINPTTYTAPSSIPPNPSLTLTATSVADTTKSFSVIFSITSAVTGVTVLPKTATVQTGSTKQFAATVTPSTASQIVTWSLSGGLCAQGGCGTLDNTVGNSVTYTAPNVSPIPPPPLNTVTLTATSVTDLSKSDSATITLVPPISVTISPKPSAVQVNTTVQLTATVSNDPQNKGVNWTVMDASCTGVPCGTVSPASTASGAQTTYTAPQNVPSPNASVSVTATSAADPTKSDSVTFAIVTSNPHNAKLSGNYAFEFNGFDANGMMAIVGSFIADGNGNMSDFTEDINRALDFTSFTSLTGVYTVNADNRGSFTVSSSQGTSTFRFALSNFSSGVARRARFIEFDDTTGSGTRGSGLIEKQNLTEANLSAFKGDFAVGLAGVDSGGNRLGAAGRFTSDVLGQLSAGVMDVSAPGFASGSTTLAGSLADPSTPSSSTGRGTATFTLSPAPPNTGGTFKFVYYIVDANEAFIVTSDNRGPGFPLLSGQILHQSGAGTFDLSSLNAPTVFHLTRSDFDVSGTPNLTVGLVTPGSSGNLSGLFDQNEGGTILLNQSLTGTYSVTSNGWGTLTLNSKPFMFYLVTQNKAFLLEGTQTTPGQDVQTGFLEPQSGGLFSNASLSGAFAFGTITPPFTDVTNESGVAALDGAGNISGISDQSKASGSGSLLLPDQAFSDTYTVSANGRVTEGSGESVLWIISPTKIVFVPAKPGKTNGAIHIVE